jgi:hypothetical protein
MAGFPFPSSSTPAPLAGEGEGRLINCYAAKVGDKDEVRRAPGLAAFATAGAGCRGMIDVNGTIYGVWGTAAYTITSGGVATSIGTIPGSDGVTLARNNRTTAGGPDIVAVRSSGGAYNLTGATVAAYPVDADLPATVNSVEFLGGYFLFTIPDGRMFASDLNSTAIAALSFATAEARPDGLNRGIVHANTFYAMGSTSIEPWLNAGTSPFPLRRSTSTIPLGLFTTMAVAGHEDGFGGNPIFVANDGTVRELRGYEAVKISTPAVERFIAGSTAATLEASVHAFRGHRIWVLSSSTGTWCYNASTGRWHERVSAGLSRWLGSRSVWSSGSWRIGHTTGAGIYSLSESTRTEAGSAIAVTIESGALKDYPKRVTVPAVFADFTKAAGARCRSNTRMTAAAPGRRPPHAPRQRRQVPGAVEPLRNVEAPRHAGALHDLL